MGNQYVDIDITRLWVYCGPYMDKINIYNTVMDRLHNRNVTQRTLAQQTGVPFSTLVKISQGSVKHPSVHTIQRLYDFFEREVA